MSDTATISASKELPKSLTAASLWRRFIVGVFVLVVGIFTAAWIFDASIEKPSARFAVPGLSESKADSNAR
ncbi:MAG: hypothetical protein AAFW82_08505 [Pseudomonadota bacterium]